MARKKEEVILIDEQEMGEEILEEVFHEIDPVGAEPALLAGIDGDQVQQAVQEVLEASAQEDGWFAEDSLLAELALDEVMPIVLAEEAQPELLLPVVEENGDSADTESTEERDEEDESSSNAITAQSRKRPRHNAHRVLSIDDEAQIKSAEEEENQLWLELRNAQRSRRILSGALSGIERLENGLPMAIVYYKGSRVAIPATEMMLNVVGHEGQGELETYNRYAQLLSRMLAAEIDFIIAGLDRRNDVVLASRAQAMNRKRQRYYLQADADGQFLINDGQIAEARVMVVSEKLLRLEVFGVETTVAARDIAWEWIDDAHDHYQVGDRVLVKIKEIHRDDLQHLRLTASIREATENPSAANLQKCSTGGKYIGTVTGIENVVYVRLHIGVNAIATTVRDPRAICRKDEVSFVVTRIDEASGLAVGIITRIIKQAN